MSLIRDNLMEREGYSPYCGEMSCKITPRTIFNGQQFKCPSCGWESSFKVEFIKEYKKKWGYMAQVELKKIEK